MEKTLELIFTKSDGAKKTLSIADPREDVTLAEAQAAAARIIEAGVLTSGGLGTMGFGFPAAIGAQFAFPDKLVIAVAGDGSLQMNIQELATAVAYKLPVKVVILNNRHLGMVRQWQVLFYNHNYSSTNMEAQPDFVKLAEAYGAEGYRIEKPEDLLPELEKALASPNPAFIDVVVEREENVYPIVPAGAALDEMLLV